MSRAAGIATQALAPSAQLRWNLVRGPFQMRLLLLALLLSANAFTQQYVRVSLRDPGYLELSSGKPYIPIGLNLIAPPRAATAEESMKTYQRWLNALSASRGNYVRFCR